MPSIPRAAVAAFLLSTTAVAALKLPDLTLRRRAWIGATTSAASSSLLLPTSTPALAEPLGLSPTPESTDYEPAAVAAAAEGTFKTLLFPEASLGVAFELAADGRRVQVKRVVEGSAAERRGVRVGAFLAAVNDKPLVGLPLAQVQALIQQAPRPVALRFDVAGALEAGRADRQVEALAQQQGYGTARLGVERLGPAPADPTGTPAGAEARACAGLVARESDVVEVEYSAFVLDAPLKQNGFGFDVAWFDGPPPWAFDSSERRSGRPFALLLGNGDAVRGLELGVLGMCVGEQRRLTVPPALGFGRKGSVAFGVPPDATLEYRVKLVSVNGHADASTRRADLPDEKRY